MTPKPKTQVSSHRSPARVTARRKMASLRVTSQRKLFRVVVNQGRQENSLATAVAGQGKLRID